MPKESGETHRQPIGRDKFIPVLVAACILLYLLSFGPCVRWYQPSPMAYPGLPRATRIFYRPIFWTADHCPLFREGMQVYTHCWYEPYFGP